ncbi:hypothetical protein EVJ50_10970 [Synechococcus sp. RSCCF101]|uniref:hypothetical protein n=1 Tax=Synechococcus sp. RSCCF101 TaxID=2511069 RepID=UPI001244835B|nr:hypothetical protein [Synechococcus sp. RSCCF101]QEY32666.1 hypothetical protein EVJ50_10970 [Synechococcus sp. RSCCF101]
MPQAAHDSIPVERRVYRGFQILLCRGASEPVGLITSPPHQHLHCPIISSETEEAVLMDAHAWIDQQLS